MRRILICTGILGGGTAITFAAAALVATMFPTGNLVYGQQNVVFDRGFNGGGIVMPAPVPQPSVFVDDAGTEPGAKGG
jgi:hypothetical protein